MVSFQFLKSYGADLIIVEYTLSICNSINAISNADETRRCMKTCSGICIVPRLADRIRRYIS